MFDDECWESRKQHQNNPGRQGILNFWKLNISVPEITTDYTNISPDRVNSVVSLFAK